jgi:hypothetical protein
MGRNVHTARFTFEERATAYREFALKITPKIISDMEFLTAHGAEAMQQNIENTYQNPAKETPYSAERFATGIGTEGRHETGTMVNAVDHEVKFLPGGTVNGSFGWVNEFLAYFGYQENGTRNIAPMYALRDARTEVAPQFLAAMHAITKSVGQGVRPK